MNKKIDKAALASRIRALEGISPEDKSVLLGLLNERKRFGIVWEENPEEAQELLRNKLPVLKERKGLFISSDVKYSPNHILIEGDNLHALTAIYYAFEGKLDAIYIDPPYNSGARDWKYNNDYVDSNDAYRHSKWISMMEHRLKIAKRLLNPEESVLIVTIDEKEFLHLGCLLEKLFPMAKIQMISTVINPAGVARENQFSRSDEYIFFVQLGSCAPTPLPLEDEWYIKADNQFKSLYWRSLSRAGSNDTRKHSPGCFYPIFVLEDGSKIHSVGEALPIEKDRESITYPLGTIPIWPIHSDGSEGCWMQSPKNLRLLIEKGYVHLGNFTERGMAIKYLNKKEIEKVESGLFQILGHRGDGSIITDDIEAVRNIVPTTQWRISSHNARSGGSELLKDILGGKVFPFPKSVHAVHDALNFYVSNKKNALILDFFAGSGTTLHATMQLNAEDGGNRRCILVTNNENNICEEVTYERNKRVIQGYTTPKGQQVEGLKNNNLRYYKVDFVDREKTAANQKELMKASTDLLCIKEDLYQEEKSFEGLKLHEQIARYFSDGVEGGKKMLIIYEPTAIPAIVKRIEQMTVEPDCKLKVYVMAEGQYPYTEDFETVMGKIELRALPHALYQAMRQVLPAPAEAENTEPDVEVSDEEADGGIYKSTEQ